MARDKNGGELGSLLGSVIGGGAVLAIEARALSAHLAASSVHEAPAPDGAMVLPPGEYDAALIGGLGALTPLAIARAAAERLRAAAVIAFALPTPRSGLKGLFRKKSRPVPLEELCEALLIAGFTGIEARELEQGTTVVWGRLAPGP